MKKIKFPLIFQIIITVSLAMFAVNAHAADAHFVFVGHSPDSDTWWNTVKNGIKAANKDFNVDTPFRNPPNGDLADMARLIEQAAAENVDGVISTIANYDVLKSSLDKVRAKGILLITVNSGTVDESRKLGALMHIGQAEYVAGKAAGERAKADGIKNYLCVNHYATNVASFERSRGFGEAIGADFKSSTIDSGQDPTEVASKVTGYLRSHPDTQSVLALGPNSADPSIQVLKKLGLAGKTYFATFDLSPDIVKGIKDGTVKFAIDQQPYLQGYIPVAILAILKKQKINDVQKATELLKADPNFQKHLADYGLDPVYGDRDISSGPGFVTKDNVEKVEKYAGEYR